MNLVNFIIFGLATWRVSNLLVNEAGPFDVFTKIRERAGIEHVDGVPTIVPDKFFAQLLSCNWCTSIWVGAGWLIMWLVLPEVAPLFAALFAFSTVAILVENQISGAK